MADSGLDRADVEGTGRDGRVMKEDVLRAEPRPRPAARARRRAAGPRAGRRSRARRCSPRTPPARSG